MKIPFNKVYNTGEEEKYVLESIRSGSHCGNHSFCRKVIDIMQKKHGFGEIFLTPSGTAALEMGAVLADIGPGDEVILPSFTFSSTVNAIILFGAKPIFCEVDPSTMNIDVMKIEELITSKTKMILPIDYAGLPCDMDKIMALANKYSLIVMQDCAQSYGSYYKGKACGTQPHIAAFSFHETKNYNAGEGGALVVNVERWVERAHFLQEKGTDRRLVLSGVKSKYSWVDKGSSYLLSDVLAAMLYAQLKNEDIIKSKRGLITKAYQKLFTSFANLGKLSIFQVQEHHELNHHAFWVIFDTIDNKEEFMSKLREKEIAAYIGYLPLHSSPKGIELGYKVEDLPLTEDVANRLVRLPFYTGLADSGLDHCINSMSQVLNKIYN